MQKIEFSIFYFPIMFSSVGPFESPDWKYRRIIIFYTSFHDHPLLTYLSCNSGSLFSFSFVDKHFGFEFVDVELESLVEVACLEL